MSRVKQKIAVKEIQPIESLSVFSESLAKMAGNKKKLEDPVGYFASKIEAMERFALGCYQWCVVDLANQQLLVVGGMIEQMTGKQPQYWLGSTAEKYVVELAPPEDIPYWMGYVQFIYKYILQDPYQNKERTLHPHIYTRMKNMEGVFKSVVMQFIDWLIDEDGGVRFCLCQTTDISHIKADGRPMMVILEVNNGRHELIVSNAPALTPGTSVLLPSFSAREKEVIRYLAAGLTSKMIAAEMGISRNTVENHRQRLLKKAGCYTSSELTAYALSNGLI